MAEVALCPYLFHSPAELKSQILAFPQREDFFLPMLINPGNSGAFSSSLGKTLAYKPPVRHRNLPKSCPQNLIESSIKWKDLPGLLTWAFSQGPG